MQADGRFDLSAVVEIMNRGKPKSKQFTIRNGVVVPQAAAAGRNQSEAETLRKKRKDHFQS